MFNTHIIKTSCILDKEKNDNTYSNMIELASRDLECSSDDEEFDEEG